MTEFLIGAGGWLYFQVPGLKPLEAYSRIFNFVEVNSTFYTIPDIDAARSWRESVPGEFEFSIRCHRDVTHKYQLEPTEESLNILGSVAEICEATDARFLVLQTPRSLELTDGKIRAVRDLLGSVELGRAEVVWEIRGKQGDRIPDEAIRLMQDLNIIHCVDLSKEVPSIRSETVYTRVFGRGHRNVYQFTDEELQELDMKITGLNPRTSAVSFHNVRMYTDAARFKVYKETGRFPSVTGAEGLQSLRMVLMEDAVFPADREDLLKRHGWKVIDLTAGRRVHASTLLERLPNREFRNIEDVLSNIPKDSIQ